MVTRLGPHKFKLQSPQGQPFSRHSSIDRISDRPGFEVPRWLCFIPLSLNQNDIALEICVTTSKLLSGIAMSPIPEFLYSHPNWMR